MKAVQPIRDKNLVRDMAEYLKNDNLRNYILFLFGIYTGRRISDILPLRVKDVRDRNFIDIKESKTKKMIQLELNPELKKAIKEYCQDKEDYEYLFQSQKGENKPIHRSTAWYILNKVAKKFDIEQIGCHTLRKTFGYHLYISSGKDIGLVMNALNHTSESVTLRYIGLKNESLNTAVKKLKF